MLVSDSAEDCGCEVDNDGDKDDEVNDMGVQGVLLLW